MNNFKPSLAVILPPPPSSFPPLPFPFFPLSLISSLPLTFLPSFPLFPSSPLHLLLTCLPPSPFFPQSLCGVPSTCTQQLNPAHSRASADGNRNRGGPQCMDTGRLPACPSWCHPCCLHIWRAAHRYMKLFSKLILLRSRSCCKKNSLEVVFFPAYYLVCIIQGRVKQWPSVFGILITSGGYEIDMEWGKTSSKI